MICAVFGHFVLIHYEDYIVAGLERQIPAHRGDHQHGQRAPGRPRRGRLPYSRGILLQLCYARYAYYTKLFLML